MFEQAHRPTMKLWAADPARLLTVMPVQVKQSGTWRDSQVRHTP